MNNFIYTQYNKIEERVISWNLEGDLKRRSTNCVSLGVTFEL
jgi:hypothetical protein